MRWVGYEFRITVDINEAPKSALEDRGFVEFEAGQTHYFVNDKEVSQQEYNRAYRNAMRLNGKRR